MKVTTEQLGGVDWVVKSGTSMDEADRLVVEAAQLRRATHPGVVEVAARPDADPFRLRTRYAGRSLTSFGPLPAAELCGLGAAVATVLADLHDLGIVHGAVTADHILIGTDGRPVLCGFGRSGSTEDLDPATDVSDLAAALSHRLGADAPRRLLGVLGAGTAGRRRTPSARVLAAELTRAMADRRLPSPVLPPSKSPNPAAGRVADLTVHPSDGPDGAGADSAGPDSAGPDSAGPDSADGVVARPGLVGAEASTTAARARAGRRARAPATVRERPIARTGRALRFAAAAAVVAAAVTVAAVTIPGAQAARHPTVASGACPAVDRGCGPVPVRHGAFVTASGTYRVGLLDPIVVLGRWTCGSGSLPAALDRRTGRVWTWSAWAARRATVTATPVVTSPGARTLRVVPRASGCDRLEVIDADGAATVVRSGLGAGA